MLLPNSCIMFPSVFALMHFTCHPCHDVPSPRSIPPPHHPTPLLPIPCGHCHSNCPRCSPARRSIPAPSGLSPRGCCGSNATQQSGEGALPKSGEAIGEGRKEGREGGGGTADMLATALWCYATSCTHTHAHIL